MPHGTRNSIEENGWLFTKLQHFEHLKKFDCGNGDLNEYFKKDAIAHRDFLLTQTYEFKSAEIDLTFPIGLASVCNDAVDRRKVKNLDFFKALPPEKHYPSYPAVKIARLGVHVEFHGNNFGTYIVNLIKRMFVTDNRTGCRLITVDAYNQKNVLSFYNHNDFQFFSDKDEKKQTRAMFFDLKRIRDNL